MRKKHICMKLKIAAGILAAAICMIQSVDTVMANPHYDRRSTVAEEEWMWPEADSSLEKGRAAVSKKAWQKINGICYNGSGVEIPGAITRGIDVSEWQGKINWSGIKSCGVDFAFVRISYGTGYLDKTYDYNMEQAELAGVPVGTYVYSTATTTMGALKEAQLAIRKMNGYKVSYPVVFDLEYSKAKNLSKQEVSKMALTFCNEVRKAGYYPMVYCNLDWYRNYIDWNLLSGIDVWIASYGDRIQAPNKDLYSYAIWQSTDGNEEIGLNSTRGLITGIPKENDVDVNFGYVDYTQKITPRWNVAADYVASSKPDTSMNDNGTVIKNGWIEEDGKTYYYVAGDKTTGWKTIDGKTYYFHLKTGAMYQNRVIKVDGEYYYMDETGARVASQWAEYNGKTYYLSEDGKALKGLKKLNGKYYWFHTKYAYMFKDKVIIRSSGPIYYVGSDGACYTNGMRKVTTGGKTYTYYFKKNGQAHKGWLTYKGKKYYFYNGTSKLSGTRAENIRLTSSKNIVSVFNSKGVCVKRYKK